MKSEALIHFRWGVFGLKMTAKGRKQPSQIAEIGWLRMQPTRQNHCAELLVIFLPAASGQPLFDPHQQVLRVPIDP